MLNYSDCEQCYKDMFNHIDDLEQHNFVRFYVYDKRLQACLRDLEVNWTDQHGEWFCEYVRLVRQRCGI